MKSLEELIKEAVEKFNSLPPEKQEAMMKAQRESWAQAEASWPKPQYHFENGVKIYHSYEDYCND